MGLVEELFRTGGLTAFKSKTLYYEPMAIPQAAAFFRKRFGWPMLESILSTGYSDCWLAEHGRLPEDASLRTGRLTFQQAYDGFEAGQTVVIRHAERAEASLAELAKEFESTFVSPVDIQLYATPEGREGFDWHYDIEDVFVLQSSGEKEFSLLKPAQTPSLEHVDLTVVGDFRSNFMGPELRCTLKAGDLLYIPTGYWHRARAITPSFHASVGVMSREHPLRTRHRLSSE